MYPVVGHEVDIVAYHAAGKYVAGLAEVVEDFRIGPVAYVINYYAGCAFVAAALIVFSDGDQLVALQINVMDVVLDAAVSYS